MQVVTYHSYKRSRPATATTEEGQIQIARSEGGCRGILRERSEGLRGATTLIGEEIQFPSTSLRAVIPSASLLVISQGRGGEGDPAAATYAPSFGVAAGRYRKRGEGKDDLKKIAPKNCFTFVLFSCT